MSMMSSFSNFSTPLTIAILVVVAPSWIAARSTPDFASTYSGSKNDKWLYNADRIINSRRGSHIIGISKLKKYFHRFGCLPSQTFKEYDDVFDEQFESAVSHYQSKFGLPVTGKLNFNTVSQIMAPRCGVSDALTTPFHALHARKTYAFFPGKPRWTRQLPMTLSYGFSKENLINYLNISEIQSAFKRAFGAWASVIPVSFEETDDYDFADIRIGFYSGDHGDGQPFDGVLGVLAHSFTPENGNFHLDAAETWAVDFEKQKSAVAVDLESVAIHEIGHLLGLSHSSVKDAVMYPSLKPRGRKVDLGVDDIQGVQALYGSNPNFTLASLLESDTSANQCYDFRFRRSMWALLTLMWIFLIG